MAMADPEPSMQRAVAKGTSTLDRVRSIVLVIGYALSVVAALGVLFVGFTSLTADPSVSCARSLGKVDQGCRAQITLLQALLFIIGLTVAPASVLASVRSPIYLRRLGLAFLPLLVMPLLVALVWLQLLHLAG
jgi:hypothetical protein